jgi:hypothetical protein
MTGNRRTFIVCGLCVMLTASTAWAGGNGGGKRDPQIRVRNDSSMQMGLGVGLTDEQLTNIAAAADPIQAWQDAGGRILNPGQTVTIRVREGNTRIITAMDPAQGLLGDRSINLRRGDDRLITIGETGQINW